jgi:hypothetical protein
LGRRFVQVEEKEEGWWRRRILEGMCVAISVVYMC